MGCLVPFIVNTIALMVVAGFFPGFTIDGFGAAIVAGLVLTLINLVIRPLLIFFTLPLSVISFGLFIFVINALMLMLTSAVMGDAFNMSGFGMAFLAAVVIAVLNMLMYNLFVNPLSGRKTQ